MLFCPGTTYLLPNPGSTRADYLAAVQTAGCTLRHILDVPLRAVPPSHFPDSMRRDHGAKPFCLIILAQKPDAEAAP